MNKPKIFLDCDGVLADFDAQACVALGVDHRVFEDSYGEDEFWRRLRAQPTPGFFRSMLPMPDARELVEALTAHSRREDAGVYAWAVAHLGKDAARDVHERLHAATQTREHRQSW